MSRLENKNRKIVYHSGKIYQESQTRIVSSKILPAPQLQNHLKYLLNFEIILNKLMTLLTKLKNNQEQNHPFQLLQGKSNLQQYGMYKINLIKNLNAKFLLLKDTYSNIIEKIKKVLTQEELQVIKNLMKNRTMNKDQKEQTRLQKEKDENEDFIQEVYSQKQEQHRSFLRKVPNFFLAMFKKWLSQQGFYLEYRFLDQLRNQKKSKQHRFELCDLKVCFKEQQMMDNQVINLKPLFNDFLNRQAKLKIINSKKASIQNKSKYIQHIEQLLQELKEEQPFKNYYKLVPSKHEKRKLQEEDSFYNSMTKRTHIESLQIDLEYTQYSNEDDILINFDD